MAVAERQIVEFGTRLREARERRGLSLRVIADTTKISVRALEALERNDISQLPGGIFSRSFVRAYALEVGLDPEQTIAEFMTRFPHESVTQGHPRSRNYTDTVRRSGGVALKWVVAAVVVAAAAAAVLSYFGAFGPLLGR